MRYFVPDLKLGVLLPEQTELCEKFGGKPWGLPAEKWPLCTECGKPLSHLFTLKHSTERLDLGAKNRVVMAFMCNHDPGACETWDSDSGANAVLILEEAELGGGSTNAPEPGGAQTETEAFIMAWKSGEDDVPVSDEAAFFDDIAYFDLSEERFETVYNSTKLCGLPAWIQAPEGPSVPPFRFTGQFDSGFVFPAPPPSAARAFCPLYRFRGSEREAENPPDGWISPPGGPAALYVREDETYRCEGPNYGGGGMAYLFLLSPATPDELPQGKLLWQCT